MKTMAGACWRACSKRSRTRAAPTPTNISTNSEPEIEKNGNTRLAGDSTGKQRLAGARRANQQHALGHVRAEPAIAFRILEKRDDLLELVLRLIDARHIGEGGLDVLLDKDLGLALADRHHAAHSLSPGHRPDEEHPDQHEAERRHQPAQHSLKKARSGLAGERQIALRQRLREAGIDAVCDKVRQRALSAGSLYVPVIWSGPTTRSVTLP